MRLKDGFGASYNNIIIKVSVFTNKKFIFDAECRRRFKGDKI